MLIIKRFLSQISSLRCFDFAGKNYKWSNFLGLRVFLFLLLLSSFLIAGIVVGAQILNLPENNAGSKPINGGSQEKSKQKSLENFDIRVNGQENLGKINELNSPGKSKSAISKKVQEQGLSINKAIARLKNDVPSAEIKVSPLTGAVEIVRSSDALTGINPGRSGFDIVRDFINSNGELYGLRGGETGSLHFIGESISEGSGLRMVRVEQMVNERPVFQSETRFILDRDGRIIQSLGLFVPQAATTASRLDSLISAQEALRLTAGQLGIGLDVSRMNLVNDDSDSLKMEIIANDEQITDKVTSKIVYFPVAPGVLVPAWSQIIFTPDADYYVLVDARNGTLLWRKNIRNSASTQDARFRVYVQADNVTPADNPAPASPNTAAPGSGMQFPEIAPTIVSMLMAQDILASPNGWINDCPGGVCTANETQTLGNNALVCLDQVQTGGNANICDTNAQGVIDGNGRPTGNPDANGRNRDFLGTAPRDFQTGFLPPPQGGMPEVGQTATGNGNNGTLAIDQFRRGMITHLFYLTNWYHDKLFRLGFDEAAGNFQQTNFSGMGLGNDRVNGDADDGSGTNNANFATPPDGTSGRMQMYRFTGPTIDRDGGLDAEIVIHELTHGTSNRLVGNGAGLQWDVGAGMGEGWSDFYALSLLNNTNADTPNARFTSGSYATYKLSSPLYTDNYVYGIRRFPYSAIKTVNPLTWADVDDVTNNLSGGIPPTPISFNLNGAMEVHNSGEVWAETLWDVRSRVITDPAGANGDVPTGNQTMLQIVTDGLKMTPLNPSFTEARDALIDADCAANACANEQSIWDGFANRGLGYKSSAPLQEMFGYSAGHLGIKESFEQTNLDVQGYTIDDSAGNNNNSIDANEPIKITVNLRNPWRNAAKGVDSATATLTSSTTGVTITDGNSTYGAIPAQGSADGDTFAFTVPNDAVCGQSLTFTIQTTSALGVSSSEITLRVGQPNGTGAPITYTRSSVAKGIPDNRPRGVTDTLTITDDYEIADLDFRVDNIQHTFTGDLTVLLKSPNGYGTDFVSLIGGLTDGGPGDNIINMVIDDDLPSVSTNDMVQATSAAAPYTKSWLPVFNSPWTTLAGFPAPDPVGELSRLDGTSTKGTWTILVSDQAATDTGTLNGWSLIVTPRAFTCTPYVNVAPTLDAIGDQTILEDAGTQTVNLTGISAGAGNSGQSIQSVTATSDNAWLIPNPTVTYTSSEATGSLSYTPTADANGTATITVTVTDNGGTDNGGVNSFTRTFTVTVIPVNDAPSFTKGPNQVVSENSGTQRVDNWATNISAGPPNESDQTLNFIVTNDNNSLFSMQPDVRPSGRLVFTPAPDAFGTATVTVRLMDDGGTANGGQDTSAPQTFTILITSLPGTVAFSSATYTVSESAGVQTVTVTRTNGDDNTVMIRYATVAGGTANGGAACTAGVDYVNVSGTLTFNDGVTSQSFNIPICNDSIGEGSETINLVLNTPGNGVTIGSPNTAVVTITDDDTIIGVAAARKFEGNSGTTNLTFNVTLSTSNTQTVTVNYATANGTATAGVDYAATSGTLTFAPGETTKTINVAVNGDLLKEANETFFVNFSVPTNATLAAPQGIGIIIDEDRAYAGDFDRDLRTDFTVFRPDTGFWYTLQSSNNTSSFRQFGTSTDIIAPGDYDGDGVADLAYFRPSTGVWFILQSSTNTVSQITLGTNGDIPVPGDYDGDGRTNAAVFRPGSGTFYTSTDAATNYGAIVFGASGDIPVQGDYDGDGRTDAAVYRSGTWYVMRSTLGFTGIAFGTATDKPVVGDFDGDGKADFTVYRPSAGTFFSFQSLTNTSRAVAFGSSEDIPVNGDYDGDGTTDIGVWRPSNGTFYFIRSSNNTVGGQQWGQAGDIPTPSRP